LGFGKPQNSQDLAEFILSKIRDRSLINEGIIDARDAVCDIVDKGIDHAMNKYN